MGNSEFFSSWNRRVIPPSSCEGNSGFHLSHCKGIRHYLELRGHSLSFPLIGEKQSSSTCNVDLGITFKWQFGSQDFTQVEVGKSYHLELQRSQWSLLSSCRTKKLGVLLYSLLDTWCFLENFHRELTTPLAMQREISCLWICIMGCRISLESWRGSCGSPLLLGFGRSVPGDLQWSLLSSSLGTTHL